MLCVGPVQKCRRDCDSGIDKHDVHDAVLVDSALELSSCGVFSGAGVVAVGRHSVFCTK